MTLSVLFAVPALLICMVAWLAPAYGIAASAQGEPGYRSVLAQLAGAVAGQGVLYYATLAGATAVLILSADTSFTGFPRLCRVLAQDGFLPRDFSLAGRRLVFTAGVVYLAVTAGVLLIAFGGITDRLIPLFAIGALLTFVLSQAAMTVHWRRAGGGNSWQTRLNLSLSGAGALASAVALAVVVVAKFSAGAWITLLVIPLTMVLLRAVRHYYDRLYSALRVREPLVFASRVPLLLVMVESWSEAARQALDLAMCLSDEVVAFHLTETDRPGSAEAAGLLKEQWPVIEEAARASGHSAPKLCILPSPDRRLDRPVLEYVQRLELSGPVAVMIPHLVHRHWWERILHTGRAVRLRRQLLRYGAGHIAVLDLPRAVAP